MTTSHSDAVRLFFLLLSVILRNIWTLLKAMQADACVKETDALSFKEAFKKEVVTGPGAS